MPTTRGSGVTPAGKKAARTQPASSHTSGSIVMRAASSEKRGKTTSTRPFSARANASRPGVSSVTARLAMAIASGAPSRSGAGGPPSTRALRRSRSARTRAAAASSPARGSRPERYASTSAVAAARCAGSVWQTSRRSWPASAVRTVASPIGHVSATAPISRSSETITPRKPTSPRRYSSTIRRENVAGTPEGSSRGYTGCDVITHSTPAAIASKNGTRCTACISSQSDVIVGSFRWASSGE